MIYSNILRGNCKECIKERYPYLTVQIRLVQHRATISAIAELSLVMLQIDYFNHIYLYSANMCALK